MAAGRLGLYNVAMRAVGERPLDSLDEDVDAKRMLDEVWSSGGGALRYFLEQGFWNFAMRAVQMDSDSDVTVQFGFQYAFEKPTDFIRLNQISGDETFSVPLERYEVETGYFYCDVDPLYLRYVSDDDDYGGDFSQWPETFTLWAGHWMACQIAPRLKNDLDMERLEKRTEKLLTDARSKDAQMEPTRFKPLGRWARSRYGSSSPFRRDRGPRNSLIG